MSTRKIYLIGLILLAVTLACSRSTTGNLTPVPQKESKAAIESYASDVLGLDIKVTLSIGATGDIDIPASASEEINAAVKLAGVTYLGAWANGMASVSLGSGQASGDYNADLQDASVGIFSLRSKQAMPGDAEAALAMIRAAYPNMQSVEFVPAEAQSGGFAFTSNQAQDIKIRDGQAILVGTVISTGVLQAAQKENVVIWIVVASGQLARPLEK